MIKKLCECGCGLETKIGADSKIHNRFIYGHAWNGRSHSEETKKKISIANKGRIFSKESNRKNSESHKGKNNHFYNKKHTQETKLKMSESHKGKKSTEETKQKQSESISGKNHPNWQGGKSFEPYCLKFSKQLKEDIRKQYDRKCFNCNKDEKDNKRKLSVHHVDYNKDQGCNGKTFELIPLCLSCHMKTNFNRKYWENKFINKLK